LACSGGSLLVSHLFAMILNRASGCCADDGVVAHHVACNAADGCTFEAAFRFALDWNDSHHRDKQGWGNQSVHLGFLVQLAMEQYATLGHLNLAANA
jgi:hypothetical protein